MATLDPPVAAGVISRASVTSGGVRPVGASLGGALVAPPVATFGTHAGIGLAAADRLRAVDRPAWVVGGAMFLSSCRLEDRPG